MPRYTQEDRDRALGALMASAVEVEGEWQPNFRGVARELRGPTHQSLRRWWRERDPAGDVALRAAHARATEALQEQGAATWLASAWRKMQRATDLVLEEACERAQKVKTDRGVKLVGPSVDQRARALRLVSEILPVLGSNLEGNDTGKVNDRIARLRRSAERAGLAVAEAV